MFLTIDHIGIAVENLSESKERLLGMGGKFVVERENEKDLYRVAIFMFGEMCVSLITPTTLDSFVWKHLDTQGEGIQHIGIEVNDLAETISQLEKQGVKVANHTEYDTRKEVLVSAKYLFGYVLQLIEWKGDLKGLSQSERMSKTWA